MLSATRCDSRSNFVREVESIEHAKKTISAPTPMEIDSFQERACPNPSLSNFVAVRHVVPSSE